MAAVSERDYLEAQPPERHEPGALEAIRERIDAGGRPFAVIDDDPTGTQCVHGVPVLTTWEEDDLAAAMNGPGSACFVLTNSRSMPPDEAEKVNRDIGQRLGRHAPPGAWRWRAAATPSFAATSRLETDTLAAVLAGTTGRAVEGGGCPAFFEGGRLDDRRRPLGPQGERLTPGRRRPSSPATRASATPHSNLASGSRRRAAGAWPAAAVVLGGPGRHPRGRPGARGELLAGIAGGRPSIVNAEGYDDLEVFVDRPARGRGAGRVLRLPHWPVLPARARRDLRERPATTRRSSTAKRPAPRAPGLVVLGSHVRRDREPVRRGCSSCPRSRPSS